MANYYQGLQISSESDVEQKLIYQLLTRPSPDGLGFDQSDFRTKVDIRKISIDKGLKKKLYFPDYALIQAGLPVAILEAKAPGENLDEALREGRLYATEINASYPRNINPCELIIVSDGKSIIATYWDQDIPIADLQIEDLDSMNESFEQLLSIAARSVLSKRANGILSSIRSGSKYLKPIHMLGGKAVINEVIGDNSFGANISVEYKYLFNPESPEDRASVVKNAYVTSKRKQAHVPFIDKIIRATLPRHVVDAKQINDSSKPAEIYDQLSNPNKVRNEICLLIGSVGSGKSTFTDYLRLEGLPRSLAATTEWINLNLNKAPLSRELIYKWVVQKAIDTISAQNPKIDFNDISILKKIYSSELSKVERGKAALYPKDSEKYIDIIFEEIDRLQRDPMATLRGMIQYLYSQRNKLFIIVLDNCDKRTRDDQLLMFDVATWLKTEFICMIFLPLRDTTYDQYRDEPPLDTVIKDLVFRIDAPLLERVIYARLQFALREIDAQKSKFTFHLPNSMKVECSRNEVAIYLRCMVSSLFQDQLFRRIITGLAGRNIRKGLEILLDFCKSGHIDTEEILRIRTSDGEHKLPNHLIARILLKGRRKYYSDSESYIKNLFHSNEDEPLPDPFVRVAALQWLRDRRSIPGPNRTTGFHKIESLVRELQGMGHASGRIMQEIKELVAAGCIHAENQREDIASDDLIALAPAGFIHLDLLRNINYLSTVAEDVLFRENQVAKGIADNLVGQGRFQINSRQTAISNAKKAVDYLSDYYDRYFVGSAKLLTDEKQEHLTVLSELKKYVEQVAENDQQFRSASKLDAEYPPGSQVNAQIVSLQNYGFFVEFGLNGGGLIHRSQLGNIVTLDDVETGDWITAEIISFNAEHKRFDLKFVGMNLV